MQPKDVFLKLRYLFAYHFPESVYFGAERMCRAKDRPMPLPDRVTSTEPSGRSAVASYVATLSADLASLARRTGLDTLGYLLEMVRLEAESASRNGQNGRR
jgi:hypothetical protein